MSWKEAWDLFLEKGFKVNFKFPWFSEKDLPGPVNPYDQKKEDATDDIVKSLDKEYECESCGKKKKQQYICKCTNCDEFVCNTCYTIINNKAWCPKCLKKRKNNNK